MRAGWSTRHLVHPADPADSPYASVALAGAPAPQVLTAPQAPVNPENGHIFECPCGDCSRWWCSQAGTAVFWDWMRRRPPL